MPSSWTRECCSRASGASRRRCKTTTDRVGSALADGIFRRREAPGREMIPSAKADPTRGGAVEAAMIQRMFRSVSDKSRQRKLDLFYRTFNPTDRHTILDLGGEASHNDQPNLQLLSSYPHRQNLTLVNLF